MELDERVMDKILADVREIVAEPDGTLRFIFYSPYSEEIEEDEDIKVDSRIEDLRDVIISKERCIDRLRADIESRDATIKLLEEKLAGGGND